MSKVKKIAEEFLVKYPSMFSTDFEANKKALDQIAVIRNRALRNQIAGAITAMAGDISENDAATKEKQEEQDSPSTETIAQQTQ